MEILETAVERFDRLVLAGVLSFADSGLAQWCFACRSRVLQPMPAAISHAAIDALAEGYLDHAAGCFSRRHGQRL
jgi:hypothetical protein